ncbi:exodeoxyribonuclease VII small subunit [Nesterenkonia sp. F]|uniref:exodeoxyribonuclease VII small subunit n=1 Tax=Nesterenkonia sp. F TaxID=795955 RepID=UPI000255C8F3|nr:exodeoxyribonuclease VII small subunit [Nesterenkonia sp. F]
MSETPETPETSFSTAELDDVESMSYEQARDELVQVVTKLETGGAPLEESLALWQRGEALADRCERWLDGARTKLQEVRASLESDGPDGADGGSEDTASS